MFPIRRAALRFLSTKSIAVTPRAGTAVSFASPSFRIQTQTSALLYQRRWASDEPPVSKIEPTLQAEVDNVVQEDVAPHTADTEPHQSRPVHAPKPTLYVGNLFFDVTEDDLTKEMSRFGTITRVKIIRDPRGLSKGFGYVSFSTTEQATTALSSLNNQLFEGRRLALQFAANDDPVSKRPRGDSANHLEGPRNPPSRTLFIGNMSFSMTDRDLNAMFKDVENLVDVRVAVDRRTGQPRGFAHADFTDVKSAMAGLKLLEKKESYGRRVRVDYSYAPSTAPKNLPRDEGDL